VVNNLNSQSTFAKKHSTRIIPTAQVSYDPIFGDLPKALQQAVSAGFKDVEIAGAERVELRTSNDL